MNALVLTEGGREIGLGHLSRCTALCQALQDRAIQPRLLVHGDDSLEPFLPSGIAQRHDWLSNDDGLARAAASVDLLVVDSYLAPKAMYVALSRRGPAAAYFDDYIRMLYPPGLVVNGAVLAEEMPYPPRQGVEYLLGIRYAPLRRPFWSPPAKSIRKELQDVLITMGGSDVHDLTSTVLTAMEQSHPYLIKTVIIGSAFQNLEGIQRFESDRARLVFQPSAEEMLALMVETDLAVTACGQTLYELATVGTPAIGICAADNQAPSARGWEKTGFLELAGWYNHDRLAQAVSAAVERMSPAAVRGERSRIGRQKIDGQGCHRIVQALIGRAKH